MTTAGYHLRMKTPRTKSTLIEITSRCIETRWTGTKDELQSVARAKYVVDFLGQDVDPAKVSRTDARRLIDHLRAQGSSPATINRALSALNSILEHAREMGARGEGGFDRIYLREPRGRLRVVSDTELAGLLTILTAGVQEGAREPRVARLVSFLRGTGMRVSEALALRWEDLTRADEPGGGPHGMVLVRESKNGTSRLIPLSAQAESSLREAAAAGEDREGPFSDLTASTLNKAWRRASEALFSVVDREFVPHALRHTRATELVSAGVPLAVVMQVMGHKSIRSTMRYAHCSSAAAVEWLTRTGKLS